MKKENRIAFRVTDQEKKRITVLARKCGLSVSEYVKQRALGYAPQPIIPESVFLLLEKSASCRIWRHLQKRAKNPSEAFLARKKGSLPGLSQE